MGNRSGCSMFSTERRDDEKYFIEGLTSDENQVLKQIFLQMDITRREISIIEFKRTLDLQMSFMRKRKRITHQMEQIYDYIDVLLNKDMHSRERYRIGLNEFMVLWQNALHEKRLEDRRQWKDIKNHDSGDRDSCLTCLVCQKRDKSARDIYSQENLKPHELRKAGGGSLSNFNTKRDSLIQSPLERSTLTTTSTAQATGSNRLMNLQTRLSNQTAEGVGYRSEGGYN
eukprot:403355623